ncbi:MAG TPA: hypothetical protein VD947_02235, partial [Patescibacteria group bacterium]|nr:hypothetical protein [Patescibacteria group bacterium]
DSNITEIEDPDAHFQEQRDNAQAEKDKAFQEDYDRTEAEDPYKDLSIAELANQLANSEANSDNQLQNQIRQVIARKIQERFESDKAKDPSLDFDPEDYMEQVLGLKDRRLRQLLTEREGKPDSKLHVEIESNPEGSEHTSSGERAGTGERDIAVEVPSKTQAEGWGKQHFPEDESTDVAEETAVVTPDALETAGPHETEQPTVERPPITNETEDSDTIHEKMHKFLEDCEDPKYSPLPETYREMYTLALRMKADFDEDNKPTSYWLDNELKIDPKIAKLLKINLEDDKRTARWSGEVLELQPDIAADFWQKVKPSNWHLSDKQVSILDSAIREGLLRRREGEINPLATRGILTGQMPGILTLDDFKEMAVAENPELQGDDIALQQKYGLYIVRKTELAKTITKLTEDEPWKRRDLNSYDPPKRSNPTRHITDEVDEEEPTQDLGHDPAQTQDQEKLSARELEQKMRHFSKLFEDSTYVPDEAEYREMRHVADNIEVIPGANAGEKAMTYQSKDGGRVSAQKARSFLDAVRFDRWVIPEEEKSIYNSINEDSSPEEKQEVFGRKGQIKQAFVEGRIYKNIAKGQTVPEMVEELDKKGYSVRRETSSPLNKQDFRQGWEKSKERLLKDPKLSDEEKADIKSKGIILLDPELSDEHAAYMRKRFDLSYVAESIKEQQEEETGKKIDPEKMTHNAMKDFKDRTKRESTGRLRRKMASPIHKLRRARSSS